MLSELSEAMIINAAVWGSVLVTDLGPARKVSLMRIVRPLVVAAVIVPLFAAKPATHGVSLLLEVAGIVAGLLGGLAAVLLMPVYRSPETGKPVTRAGWGYAALWTIIIGARATFSYGCVHWWPTQLVHFGIAHQVSAETLADSLIAMAIVMLVTRTLGMWARAATLTETAGREQAPAIAGTNS